MATSNAKAEKRKSRTINSMGDRTLGFISSRMSRTLLAFGLIIAGFGLGLIIGVSSHNPKLEAVLELPSMSQCTKDTLSLLDQNQPAASVALRQALEHCYSLIRSQGLLRDFAVREVNFIQQYRANAVLMWMVVVITFSGVILAAIQLLASRQLAASRKVPISENELSVKRDQVILKSSITGLFILLISFAFFLVYVTYVYQFKKIEPPGDRSLPNVQMLPMGQLGTPQ